MFYIKKKLPIKKNQKDVKENLPNLVAVIYNV